MKIAINGAGVAGPALAWWLRQYGHEAVMFERAPALRSGGYMIDFWGTGYDIAERMGVLPTLQEKGYLIEQLQLLDERGQQLATTSLEAMRALVNDRLLSISRSDVAATLFHACDGIETHFDTHVVAVEQDEEGVDVTLSSGARQRYDLLVGADGLHSQIRALTFGPDSQYEKDLGVCVAAFTVSGYPHRDELTYLLHSTPGRQVARISLRDDRTLFLFTFRAALLEKMPASSDEQVVALQRVFGEAGWEVPDILARLGDAQDLYFDHVSQIRMDRWTQGRVALIGDAAACASLLAGEGTGLAMTEAYVLAGELNRADGDYRRAFENYERRLQPFLRRKQQAALRMVSFFAPENRLVMTLIRWGLNLASIPFVSRLMLGGMLRDDISLPDYAADLLAPPGQASTG